MQLTLTLINEIMLVDFKKEELNNVVEHTQIRIVKAGSGG